MDSLPLDSHPLRLSSPTDVLAAVPYLLGFTPADSVVVIGLRAKKIVFQIRADIPPGDVPANLVGQVTAVVARQRINAALVIGYGAEPAVSPVVVAVRAGLQRRDIRVLEVLRVTDGRYWSYLCAEPTCCPPGGTAFDVSSSAVAAAATVAGMPTVGSREEFATRVAPVGGEARLAMCAAAGRADLRLSELLDERATEPSGPILLAAGKAASDLAVLRLAYGGQLDDDDVAWLTLLLINPPVRDYAWSRIGEDLPLHIELWADVLRRADTGLAAAPATLLAFAAWRHGDGALSSIALDRALQADPNYPMAHLLSETIQRGVSPSEWMDLIRADEEAATQRPSRHRTERLRVRGARGRVPVTRPAGSS